MPPALVTEASTVQFPLIRHATDVGWTLVSQEDATHLRGGESGAFFSDELRDALVRLNPGFVTAESAQAIIQRIESAPATLEGNQETLEWLRGNRTVYDETERRHRNITLIDFDNVENNTFHVTYEWKCQIGQRKGNRADIIFLVNGIPVAIIENKNPKRRDALERAIVQLRRYELETPELLLTPQVFNVTHLLDYHYGVTWNYTRKGIFNWKSERSESYREAVHSFFAKPQFLAMLQEWILFYIKDDELLKTVLRQHQTRAVTKVVDRCADPHKSRGLVWHTQGSGKTFTLITAARLILEDSQRFPGATVLLVVDRNELEGQLSGWVDRMVGEMRKSQVAIAYADSRARLQDLLAGDFRGLIVSMIHKFDGIRKDVCTRHNVYVLIDEAHRSVGGDLGTYLMGALPNATLIGFTGTPIDKTAYGQGTFKVFGVDDPKSYLDKYPIRESIEDQTTVKLRHTLAPGELRLPTELLEKEFLSLAEAEGVSDIAELNRILERAVNLRTFLKASDRVEKIAQFVAKHFRENVEPLGYKAFLVAVDREACALYKQALDRYLPADHTVPVYTKSVDDSVERPLVAQFQLSESAEKAARKRFPRPNEDPKIFIVTDKLLTGYDAPVLYCMYLDKPMRDHVLLQAIARVNRPYEDEKGVEKPCGLVIDFVGVLKELRKALAFDSDDVATVIEDLDLLLARFIAMMTTPGQSYLRLLERPGPRDEVFEQIVYRDFVDKDRRNQFAEYFKELEGLYEILSPSAELRDYMDDYNRLAELYASLRNAYGPRGSLGLDLAHKTARLVREQATVGGPYSLTKSVDFSEAALKALQDAHKPDAKNVVNITRAFINEAAENANAQPYLISIADRAEQILEALEDRQLSTEQAQSEIARIVAERERAMQIREEHGLDDNSFAIYWALKDSVASDAVPLAKQSSELRNRYPNAASNSDEYRQLKAEMYKLVLRFVARDRMVELTERILGVPRT